MIVRSVEIVTCFEVRRKEFMDRILRVRNAFLVLCLDGSGSVVRFGGNVIFWVELISHLPGSLVYVIVQIVLLNTKLLLE